jgi:hypothetical protein
VLRVSPGGLLPLLPPLPLPLPPLPLLLPPASLQLVGWPS